PHATHDLELLASVADRDRDPETDATVARMVASCTDCAALVADLRSLALGLAGLPPTIAAPRDMRLSPERGAQVRRGAPWRRRLGPFGDQGVAGLRPLAGLLTTLGVAGLLLTVLPLGLGSGGASLSQLGSAVSDGAAAA